MGKYEASGLSTLGTPCGDFANQEPGGNDEILAGLKYVRPGNGFVPAFPLMQKASVNGLLAHPIWNAIRAACESPVLTFDWTTPSWSPVTTRDVQWNFQTVLVDKKGNLYRRYSTTVDPADIAPDIEVLLAQ